MLRWLTRYRYSVHQNITYKTIDGANLTAEFLIPRQAGPKAAVVVVHGGSWQSKSGRMSRIKHLLASSGYVVMNVTYRLVPESLYPKAVDDVRDAIQYLYDRADQYQVDRNRLAGWGYSAGSQLVLLNGLNPKNHLKAMVAGGTPADFLAWPESPIVTPYLGATMKDREDLWREASPISHVQSDSPPVFLYHGRLDRLVEVEQMFKMQRALQAKNVEVEVHEPRWLGHISTYLLSLKSVHLGIRFLDRHI
jgi:acetyl esterase/lipase